MNVLIMFYIFVHINQMCIKMGNQQLCNLENKIKQVILSGILGDNCLHSQSKTNPKTYNLSSSCIHKEYINFKSDILKNYNPVIGYTEKNGYCSTPIYTLRTRVNPIFGLYKSYSLANVCEELDEFGLALWFYDDCSLHKTKLF